jgi:hypothetical protein
VVGQAFRKIVGRVGRIDSSTWYWCDWTLRIMSTGAYTKEDWVNIPLLSLHVRPLSALRNGSSVVNSKCKRKDGCALLETQPAEPEVSDSERVALRSRALRAAACSQSLCDMISELCASFGRALHEMM